MKEESTNHFFDKWQYWRMLYYQPTSNIESNSLVNLNTKN